MSVRLMGGAPPKVVRVVGGASLMSACVCLVGGAPPVSLQSLSLKFVC